MALASPHVLLASGNINKMIVNLGGVLSAVELEKIEDARQDCIIGLLNLGITHYNFSISISNKNWRHKVSRFYYSAYNCRRSVELFQTGQYKEDSTDHEKVKKALIDKFPNAEMYVSELDALRSDRNTSDYDFLATANDLINTLDHYEHIVGQFIDDSMTYLRRKTVIQ